MYSMEYIYQKNKRIIIWNGISKSMVSFAALISIKQWEKQSRTERISSRRPASEDITTDFSLS